MLDKERKKEPAENDLRFWEEALDGINLETGDDIAYKDPIKRAFEENRRRFEKMDPKEHDRFLGELMHWGSCIPQSGTLGDFFVKQVEFMAQRQEITPLEFVGFLFTPVEGKLTAGMIMSRLQVGTSPTDIHHELGD